MYDVLGREIYKSHVNSRSKESDLPISYLPAGIYYVRLESGGKVVTEKFVKSEP